MPLCPECGGRISPGALASAPSGEVDCRWCHARLLLHPAVRHGRNFVLGAAAAALSIYCVVAFWRQGDLGWLILLAGGLLLCAFLAVTGAQFSPLIVRAPRGGPRKTA